MPSLGVGEARISPTAGAAKKVEFFFCLSVCLFVCLFVTLLNTRDYAPNGDFAVKALEYGNDFDAVEYGKVSSYAPMFIFLRLPPAGDTTKCRSTKKWQKLGVFCCLRVTDEPIETNFDT